MPRRRPGTLLPLELEVLDAALALQARGQSVHGFGLARRLRGDDERALVAHGTLYKALGRLEALGLLTSQWEEPADGGRPRRRLYTVTGAGADAVRTAQAQVPAPAPAGRRSAPRPA